MKGELEESTGIVLCAGDAPFYCFYLSHSRHLPRFPVAGLLWIPLSRDDRKLSNLLFLPTSLISTI